MRVGINGFGRIGRAIARILCQDGQLELVAINDINPDIENMAYLLRYDSVYGRFQKSVRVEGTQLVVGGEKRLPVFHEAAIDAVPWEKCGVDLVLDASGVQDNLLRARKLKGRVRHCVVTNSPDAQYLDRSIVMGVNHTAFDPTTDFVVSGSICDANAFAPVAKILDEHFGIVHGFLTTLHPWLNYQNLLDGPSISYATPGQIHDYYALGRSSSCSLIPKTTSAISAAQKVLPTIEGKFLSMSFRVPTMNVSTADISVQLKERTTVEAVKQAFVEYERTQAWKTIYNNHEALVSVDFSGSEYSAIVDHRWIALNDQNYLKMVLWYDNEWGYSYSVVELLQHMSMQHS